MKPCDAYRETLVDLWYGLLDEAGAKACRAHLEACAGCAREMQSLDAILGALDAREAFPGEGEVDWGGFARLTVARAMSRPHTLRERLAGLVESWRLSSTPAWGAAAALMVAVSAAVLLYDRVPVGSPGEEGPGGAPGSEASVYVPQPNIDHLTVNLARENTAKYLMETRAVLVTLLDVNLDCEKGKVDISAERAKATELLRRQRLIAAELKRLPLARAQDVCGDLERLLLEISSLADCTRDDEIQTLRDVVDKRQILVRMELLSQELERQGGSHA